MAISIFYRHAYTLTYLMVMLVLLLLLFQPLSWNVVLPSEFWIRQAFIFCLWISLFYINAIYLVPRLLLNGKNGLFIAAMLVAVILALIFDWLVSHSLNLPELMSQAMGHRGRSPHIPRFNINPVLLLATMLVLGISTTVKVVQKWQKDTAIRQNLEKQKITSELSFLKAQINPHFFFNTLHSIYALTHINVESSREALYTLSRMMRYVLYETQSGTTLLSKEIEFLQDYINLMQLRLTDMVSVTFEKPAAVQEVSLAPMMFLPFIENAFKHGVSALHASSIYISLRQQDHTVKMEVRNTLLPEKRVVLEDSSGIGLANTRRRLDLLYPEHYDLAITEKTPENEYKVLLTIDVS